MMLTPEKAATKWCPMVRVATSTGANNRGPNGQIEVEHHCVASKCMMWQWDKVPPPTYERHGYCGLAGVPVVPNY